MFYVLWRFLFVTRFRWAYRNYQHWFACCGSKKGEGRKCPHAIDPCSEKRGRGSLRWSDDGSDENERVWRYSLDSGLIVSARGTPQPSEDPPRDFHKKVADLRLCCALDHQTTAGTLRSYCSITPWKKFLLRQSELGDWPKLLVWQ